MGVKRDLVLIYGAALLRSFGIGLLGVLLGIYLFRGWRIVGRNRVGDCNRAGWRSSRDRDAQSAGRLVWKKAEPCCSRPPQHGGRIGLAVELASCSTVAVGIHRNAQWHGDGSHCGVRVGTGHYSGTGFPRMENMDTLLVQPGSGQWTCTGSTGREHSLHFAAVVRN